jgi:hypothetical protein
MLPTPCKNDEAMKLALGGCEECEGNGGDLFGKKAADACTNPKYYAHCMAAYIAIKRKELPNLVLLSAEYGKTDIQGALSRNQYEEITTKKGCQFEQKGLVVEGASLGRIIERLHRPAMRKASRQPHRGVPCLTRRKGKTAFGAQERA